MPIVLRITPLIVLISGLIYIMLFQVSVITYNTHGRVEFSLEEGKLQASVLDLIDGIEYKGGKTNTAEGLELARKQMGMFNFLPLT